MSIFKEQLIPFERLAKRQERLYLDSCDFGIWLGDNGLADVRGLYQDLLDVGIQPDLAYWGDHENKRGAWGVSSEFFIPFEVDEGREVGTRLIVEYSKPINVPDRYVRTRKHIVTIEFHRGTRPIKRS